MNELIVEASRIWKKSGFKKPNILLGLLNGKYYLTTTDETTICFFLEILNKGDSDEIFYKNIYAIPKSKCKEKLDEKNCIFYYEITDDGTFQVITCPSGPFEDVGLFALNQISHLFYGI